jgi:signal transduction histidine kinase
VKKRAFSRSRREPHPAAPGAKPPSSAALPVFRELSGARGVRAPLDTLLAGLVEVVPFERASFFFLPPGGAVQLQWAANFRRAGFGEEPVVGLSPRLVSWAMADSRPKVAPPGTIGGDRRTYLFLPLWGLGEPLGLVIMRTRLEAETLDVAATGAVQGLAAWFSERIAYALAYLGAEAERSALAGREALAAELLDSISEGLLAVDAAGRVRFVNRNARIMLSLFEADYRGRELLPLLPEDLARVLEALLAEARQQGGAPARIFERIAGGVSLPLELSATRVLAAAQPSASSASGSTLVVVRNLTAGARLARLEEIDRLKTEFISTVSHELKSPLATVREAVKLLTEGTAGELTAEQRKLGDIVERNVDWLVRLINDLLDMSRLEAGRINLDVSSVDLDGLVASVAGRFQVEAERKRLDLRVKMGSGGARVQADPDRLEQVLVNLLSNAFKFTLQGFVEIATSAGADWAELAVSDSGVGIAKEDLSLIFDKFEQVGRHRELSRKGTGLGLAISRKLVELHGGTIRVESQPEKGSTFTVRLPREAGKQERTA